MRRVFQGLLIVVFLVPGLVHAAARFTEDSAAVAHVFELLDERLAVMPDVAAVKWQNHAPITDARREQAVIQNAIDRGAPLGLAPEGVRQLFELQIQLATALEERLHEQWRKSGFDGSRPILSLERDIRPKLDRITPELLRAIYLAAPALQHGDFGALAAEKLRGEGWTGESRGATLAALKTVRLLPAPALERIHASKVLRVGTTGDYAPFSSQAGDVLTGSDIEMAQSLAQALGAEPIFIKTTWATLTDDLRLYKFDIAMGGVSVTPARAAVAAFSVPYTSGGKTIISRCRDARRFGSLKAVDRRGTRVVVNPGGTNEQFVKANVHHANIKVHPDNRTIFDEIRAGRADVMITDDVEVELQTRRHSDLCRAFSGTLTHADKAILMPRDESLVKAVNEWLEPAVQSGTPARLIEQFLQPAR
jgi:cyclohexadienyl dehydratase